MVKKKKNGVKFCGGSLILSIFFIIFFIYTIWIMTWFDSRLDDLEDYTWKNQITSWECHEWKTWDLMEILNNGTHVKTGEEEICYKERAVRENPKYPFA